MILLPAPRRHHLTHGALILPAKGHIQLLSSATELLPAARAIQSALQHLANRHYSIVASHPDDDVVISLFIPAASQGQSYELEITPANIQITAASPEGTFYAAQTLTQILRQHSD